MNNAWRDVKAVGFDLDNTLYHSTPEMDDRIRNEFATKIFEGNAGITSIAEARRFFDERIKELKSLTRTLEAAGYSNADVLAKECIERADFTDLVSEDRELAGILDEISRKHFTYLVTKRPRTSAEKLLGKIGIGEGAFNASVYGDDPFFIGEPKTTAFKKMFQESGIDPDYHVYVGDKRDTDILASRSLGMKAIAVGEEIPEAHASIPHIHGLKDILL